MTDRFGQWLERHGRGAAIGAAVLALGSIAAASPGSPSGKFLGVICGATLLALVCYAFYDYLRPAFEDTPSNLPAILIGLGLLAGFKLVMMTVYSGFGVDVGDYIAWGGQMLSGGPAQMYRKGFFIDYPPGYLYALWSSAALAHLVGAGGIFSRVIMEGPALVADFGMALVMYALMKRSKLSEAAVAGLGVPLIAMAVVALNPALLYDTVIWGQTDSVMSFILLLSVGLILARQFELAWVLAAIGVLVKPQALMLLPVLGLWTMLETEWRTWIRVGIIAIATALIGIAPFQIGHEWDWIFKLYSSTAAYYHETSVNAFNVLGLIGGIRAQDSGTLGGISYFTLGMGMLVPLYLYIAWILLRGRNPARLWYCSFLAFFGFWMLAPRMHERYLYTAIVFAAPLAFEAPEMAGVFILLTLTCWFNLGYVLNALQANRFLPAHDGPAMVAAALNLVALTVTVYFGAVRLEPSPETAFDFAPFFKLLAGSRASAGAAAVEAEDEPRMPAAPAWANLDTIIISALVIAAAFFRFWRIGHPAEIVFDEVHFVGQARKYIHGEYFLDPHPPLAKLVIAAGIWLFGDHPWAWRVGNATVGTALVGITYLLGRRISGSRLGATLAAGIILFDGMFLVYSRIAVIDITYVTCGAAAYLFFFRFLQTPGARARRTTLIWMSIALGLCVAGKLYIPAITFLLVTGFLAYVLVYGAEGISPPLGWSSRRVLGTALLVGGVSGAVYIAVYLPKFYWGWWGGMEDVLKYILVEVPGYEKAVTAPTHPYSSPWWTWPLMLRPVAFWQKFPPGNGEVRTIWGGGNPLLWWGALSAIAITAVRAVERPNLTRWFLVIGYLGYMIIWVPIIRTTFLYHYLPAVYLGYLALALVLADFIEGRGEPIEHAAILIPVIAACLLGIHILWLSALICAAIAGGYALCVYRDYPAGRYVAGVYIAGAVILYFYFLPIWMGWSIPRTGWNGYYTRMWLQKGYTYRNWI
ncbi:MAG: phospholipid carrier-dependent glycosyltransferase [Candidatus Binataceae bacterium]